MLAKAITGAVVALALAGCADGGLVETERAPIAASPKGDPVRTRTSFSDALTCIDGMLLRQRTSPRFNLTTAEIRDPTKKVGVGAREMADAAMLSMSRRSKRLSVRRYDFSYSGGDGISNILPVQPIAAQRPDFAIAGAISQADAGAIQNQVRGGVAVGDAFTIGGAGASTATVIGLDLQLIDMITGELIGNAQNSITLVASERGADLDATIGKFGGFFEFTFAEETGAGQAVRTLIDLSMIELIGDLYNLPYWSCLSLDTTSPAVRVELQAWWSRIGAGERDALMRDALISAGYMGAGGEYGAALARFQADRGLPATGRASFDSFAALSGRVPTTRAQPAIAPQTPVLEALGVTVNPQFSPDSPNTFVFIIGVTRGAHVACWMQTQKGDITRFFPNPFQTNGYMLAHKQVIIPDGPARSRIAITLDMEDPAPIRVACAATGADPNGQLPQVLRVAKPFETIPGVTLDQIMNAYRAAAGTGPFATDSTEISL